MKVIITGGTGLTGTALAHSLAADGHQAAILTRDLSRHTSTPLVRYLAWDGKSFSGQLDETATADAIVNLAGAGIADARWSDARKREILDSRIDAGTAVMDALRQLSPEQRPRVLVQASAVGYYGIHHDEPVTEETPAGSDFLANVCVKWEASTSDAESLGVRRTVARTGVVFSTAGGALPQILLPFKMVVAGGPLGTGEQYVPWIHIDDEVRALRWLIETPTARGVYNLCAPNPVTNRELAQTIGNIMGRPAAIPTPAIALKAALGERATLVLDGQRQIPERLLAEGFTFLYPELRPALEALIG